jgi:hypothetical protein
MLSILGFTFTFLGICAVIRLLGAMIEPKPKRRLQKPVRPTREEMQKSFADHKARRAAWRRNNPTTQNMIDQANALADWQASRRQNV